MLKNYLERENKEQVEKKWVKSNFIFFYSTPSIIRITASRKVKWDNYVAGMAEYRAILTFLAREPE